MLESLSSVYFFRRPILIALGITCVVILAAKKAGWLDRLPSNDPANWAGERVIVTGVVNSQPDPRPTGCVYLITTETLELFSRERFSTNGQLLVQIMRSTSAIASPGDRVRVLGRLQLPKGALTPGAFDYQEYLAVHGVRAVIYASTRSFENLGNAGVYNLMRLGWFVKRRAVEIYERRLAGERATVLAGLAVGSRPRFHPETKRVFVESGTMHVLVASGSNVAFVIALWFFLARLTRVPRRWALASSLPAVWGYVLVAGADAPIARAGLMGTVGVIAYLLGREDRPYHALGLTAFVILLTDPRSLFDVGFQMSFGTVFGLIHYLRPAEEVIQRMPLWARWPLRLLAATLAAQIWVAPVTATTFQRFFPIGIISNLIVVPMSALGLTAGIAVGVVEYIPLARTPVLWIARTYLSALIGVVRFFADKVGVSVWVAPPHPLSLAGYVVCCLTVIGLRRSWFCRGAFVAGILLMLGGWSLNRPQRGTQRQMRIDWIDTGKRLATLIQTPSGERVLLNPGPREPVDTAERTLMPFFTRNGIRSLDAILITDRDPKRTASARSLETWLNVGTVTYTGAAALWLRDGDVAILIADRLTTKLQRELLRQNIGPIDVLQSHFPRNWIWLPEFVEKFRPRLAVETFPVSDSRPSAPPWPDVNVIAPQKLGWYQYSP